MVMACCGRRAEFYPRGAILKPCPYRIGRGAGWGGAVGGGKDVKWLCDENCPTPVLAIEWPLVRKGEGAMLTEGHQEGRWKLHLIAPAASAFKKASRDYCGGVDWATQATVPALRADREYCCEGYCCCLGTLIVDATEAGKTTSIVQALAIDSES